MPPFKTEAIILRTRDFGERDRIITCYSDERGKIQGIAKGAKRSKKRFGANLDILAYVKIDGFEKPNQSLAMINGADLIEYFESIRNDIRCFAWGNYLAEWIEGCTMENAPLPGLMSLTLTVLRNLEKGVKNEDLLRIFEIKVLDMAGYRPRLEKCMVCGECRAEDRQVSFDTAKGGWVCSRCSVNSGGGAPVSIGTLKILEDARKADESRLHRIAFSALARKESRGLMRSLYIHHVGKPLKSTAFLDRFE